MKWDDGGGAGGVDDCWIGVHGISGSRRSYDNGKAQAEFISQWKVERFLVIFQKVIF